MHTLLSREALVLVILRSSLGVSRPTSLSFSPSHLLPSAASTNTEAFRGASLVSRSTYKWQNYGSGCAVQGWPRRDGTVKDRP